MLGDQGWQSSITTKPNKILVFRFRYADARGLRHSKYRILLVQPPEQMWRLSGTVTAFDGAHPDGFTWDEFPIVDGIEVGDHGAFPSEVEFAMKVKGDAEFNCVPRTLRFQIKAVADNDPITTNDDESATAEVTAIIEKQNC